ncbi:MAG: FISUMP domain-containing protein [Bacteroidota bacterium]
MKGIVLIVLVLYGIWGYSQKSGFNTFHIQIDKRNKITYEQSHALIIGISDYSDGWNKLPGVKKDVGEVKNVLKLHGFNVEVYENLNKEYIDRVFSNFIKLYGQNKNNRLLFYFAGHGYTVKTTYGDNLAYIVPKNAPLPKVDLAGFQAKAMETTQIEIYAKQIKSKHVLFVFDACFSGAMFHAERTVPDALSLETQGPVRQFITSGSENENVPDNSIFRNQFVQALTTKNADLYRDDYLTGTELGEFLQTNVVNMSKNAQHPQYGKISHKVLNKGDFVFILADSILHKDNAVYGTLQLKSKISGDLYLDKRKIQTISANSVLVLKKIHPGSHFIEIKGKKIWEDTIWVYEKKLTQVLILDEIYQNSNYWMVDQRDGKLYSTVKVKDQVWMADNLNYDGGEGSYCYDDSLLNCNIYGKLYTWEAAKKLCPEGWHLPKKNEWYKLLKNLGGHEGINDFAFSQMVIGGGADFNAVFGGFRYSFGVYDYIGFHAGFWSATKFNNEIAEYLGLSKYGQNATFQNGHKQLGLSVRCIRD